MATLTKEFERLYEKKQPLEIEAAFEEDVLECWNWKIDGVSDPRCRYYRYYRFVRGSVGTDRNLVRLPSN